jgi:predicted DNA-binding transcriptional regulator YafY
VPVSVPSRPEGFDQSRAASPAEVGALPHPAQEAVRVLERCISQHHVAEVDYTDENGHKSTIRIRPGFIRYNHAHHLVLWGIARDREDWEELMLDRIGAVRDTGEEFTPSW